eukprot:gb/GEZN01003902.1/.p1 GENE.gb/GEZN01003902.1/~~gb/GEZN01003902.1/.p1  ORF type:complete len:610 (+),score=90.82 gb/GEZN01003902.1/:189-1832(+)
MMDLVTDMADGVFLINLMEIISGKKIAGYKRNPKLHIQKLENINKALEFIKEEGITLVNIGSTDLNSGNLTIILGLIWTLILRYQIQKGGGGGGAKNALLEWVNSKIAPKHITNFTGDWRDGDTLTKLTNALSPGAVTPTGDALKDTESCMTAAEERLGIPRMLDAADLCADADELSTMTYISYFREASTKPMGADATTSWAEGTGLDGAYVGGTEPATFTVHFLDKQGRAVKPDKYSVTIKDPSGADVTVDCKDGDKPGVVLCSYTPTIVGTHTVDVQVNDASIKDMPKKVEVSSKADPNKSYASGRGILTATDNDVQPANFQVHSLTADGLPVGGEVKVTVTGPSGKELPSQVNQTAFGEYDVDWSPSEGPGKYTINVTIDGKSIKDMPKVVEVLEGCIASMTNKANFQFTVWAVGKNGETQTTGGQRFECTVVDDEGIPIPVATTDNKDGSYTAAYDLKFDTDSKSGHEKHHWLVTAMFNGSHIPGSPFEHDMRGRKFQSSDAPVALSEEAPSTEDAAAPQKRAFPKAARQSVFTGDGSSVTLN